VAVRGTTAYVGLESGQLAVVELPTGQVAGQISHSGPIDDLALDGDTLFVLVYGSSEANLIAYRITPTGMVAEGNLEWQPFFPESNSGRKLISAGGGYVYVAGYPGYDVIDFRNPSFPQLVGAAEDINVNSFKQIVSNGAGIGVAAVGPNPSSGAEAHNVYLYNISNPSVTSAFLAEYPTPGLTYKVALYQGLAYVADGDAGLQVVNYLSFDNKGIAPTLTLATNFAAGVAEASKPLRLTANATDDVQVREVEFYLDGNLVASDGSFPFEVWLTAPALNVQSSFTIRAQATDTGGNSTTSTEQTLQLVADATPPRLVAVSPAKGSFTPPNTLAVVSATFDEALDAAKVNSSNFKLFSAGADGIVGTGDDQPVAGVVAFDSQTNRATFTVSPALADGRYRAVLEAGLTDVANNALAGGQSVWNFSVGVITWDGGGDGSDWHDPANWENDQLPQPGSIVVIETGVNGAVEYWGDYWDEWDGDLPLTEIRSSQPIIVYGGSITLNGNSTLAGALTLNGGTLVNNGILTLNGLFTWSGGTLSGAGTTVAQGGLAITDLGGGKTLSGHRLENAATGTWTSDAYWGWYFINGATFTNRAGASFTQQTTAYDQVSSDGSAVSITNAGTWVKANDSTNYVGVPFNNTGTVNVNAGILQLFDGSSSGTMSIGAGTTVEIHGTFENQAAGQITGTGTLNVANGNFTNNGTIAPSVTVVN
jgi:hypothetical protein